MHYPPPDPPYEGPAAHTSDGPNLPARRIVIHSTVSPCVPGERHRIAAYFRDPDAGGSAHYVVDPVGVVQVVGDHSIAWHAPGAAWSSTRHPFPANVHSFGIEMCDNPGPVPRGPVSVIRAARRTWRWREPRQEAMLQLTAQLTAELCLAYGIPARWLNRKGLRSGVKGITSHAQVSLAFGQSTHWDPGFWPRRRFMRLVRDYIAQERKAQDA